MERSRIMLDVDTWTTPTWQRYGLRSSVAAVLEGHGYPDTDPRHPHNLVSSYLDRHPATRQRYLPSQAGEVKYHDVLRMAEQEAGLQYHADPETGRWWYTQATEEDE